MSLFFVSFCCNDDHGMSIGRVNAVDIDGTLRIACATNRPSMMRIATDGHPDHGGHVKISRKWFRCRGWQTHVGNIFWDGTWMDIGEARRLAKYLLALGWDPEEWPHDGPLAGVVPT